MCANSEGSGETVRMHNLMSWLISLICDPKEVSWLIQGLYNLPFLLQFWKQLMPDTTIIPHFKFKAPPFCLYDYIWKH